VKLTCCTQRLPLDAGVALKIVSDRIGHADTATRQMYVHRSAGDDQDAARLIAGMIEQ
jgi:ABC-type molybdate transport system permease subunit